MKTKEERFEAIIKWTESNEPTQDRDILFLSDELYLTAKAWHHGERLEALNGWSIIYVQMPVYMVMTGSDVSNEANPY